MRLVNELRVQQLTGAHGDGIEGRVRVRGIDATTAGGSGFRYERLVPTEIAVQEAGATRLHPLPRSGGLRAALPYLAAPAIALTVRILLRSKG